MDKFQNKYRIPSARATWWKYDAEGIYFITICTAKRDCIFGDIQNGKMKLSCLGEIVLEEWNKSFALRKELFCDCFIIMPNHIHGILRIENIATDKNDVKTHDRASLPNNASLQNNVEKSGVAHRTPKSISSFVAGFKSSATKHINEYKNTPKIPVWQSRFHDNIIVNEQSYQVIAAYILSNPLKWDEDTFNPDNQNKK